MKKQSFLAESIDRMTNISNIRLPLSAVPFGDDFQLKSTKYWKQIKGVIFFPVNGKKMFKKKEQQKASFNSAVENKTLPFLTKRRGWRREMGDRTKRTFGLPRKSKTLATW